MATTQRIKDSNGWYEIKKNPLSKAGIFDYRGSSIGAKDPNKMYKVYRPAAELSDQACLDSFKLIPFVDDHHMLGAAEDGYMPAEDKGIHGVIGEDVRFEGDTLYSNIKVYSEKLKSKIDAGKKSCQLAIDVFMILYLEYFKVNPMT